MPPVTVRDGTPSDFARVEEIQNAAPEASHWNPAAYLAGSFRVAECGGVTAGFYAARRVAPGEAELLNLVVAPEWRRQGVGRALLRDLTEAFPGDLYLEVRESNEAALKLYEAFGFKRVMYRPGYYYDPPEGGVVMKYHSC
ncbi:MAG: GNAT family N-acetyltransferase [Bryobacteraceae bacterium]